jgi:peptide/nickel transport system permease protein
MNAARYIERRIASGLLLLLAVSVLSFSLSALVPGSFLDEMKLNPQISPATFTALRSQYGLDQPVLVRYARWLRGTLHGNLGFSFAYNTPVSSLIWIRCRNTLLLTVTATFLVWLIAVPLGILSAAKGGWLERICTMGSGLLLSLPEIAIALALLAFAVRTGRIPAGGMISLNSDELSTAQRLRDIALHLIVPASALVLAALPIVLQHTRAAMREVLEAPFIKAAAGHGIPRRRLLLRHALPAAANPLISLFGFSIAGLLSASLLVEVVTGWPGLGPLFLESIFSRDFQVVIAVVMVSSALLVLGNLMGDLLLFVADPRIRAE